MKTYIKTSLTLNDESEIILRPADDWNEQNNTFIMETRIDENYNAYCYLTIDEAEELIKHLRNYIDVVKN